MILTPWCETNFNKAFYSVTWLKTVSTGPPPFLPVWCVCSAACRHCWPAWGTRRRCRPWPSARSWSARWAWGFSAAAGRWPVWCAAGPGCHPHLPWRSRPPRRRQTEASGPGRSPPAGRSEEWNGDSRRVFLQVRGGKWVRGRNWGWEGEEGKKSVSDVLTVIEAFCWQIEKKRVASAFLQPVAGKWDRLGHLQATCGHFPSWGRGVLSFCQSGIYW